MGQRQRDAFGDLRLRAAGAAADAPHDGDRLGAVLAGASRPKEAIIATEVELKLAARARDLPALARALTARAGNGANGTRTRLVSTYFDTPDHALARQGLVLRVRECAGHFVQAVKSADRSGAAPLARGEWEEEIGGATPDPLAPETGRFLRPEIAGRLTPMFRTEVARHTIELSPTPQSRIEAAIDRGCIRVQGRAATEPVSEVELELKSGHPAVLYDVALDLLDVAPLRLDRRSKAERGYRLAAPELAPVGAVHASPVLLLPTMDGNAALQCIGLACLDQVLRNEAAGLGGLGEGIHQMRVAARRLRAVLSAFGRMLPAEECRRASGELRWLADALGAARNLDVFAGALIAPARKALGESAGLAALVAAAERQRAAAYAHAAKAIASSRYTASMLRILRWFEANGWRGDAASSELDAPIAELAARVLDRRRRVALRRSKGFAKQSAAERHRLRIALKKLRYTAEALAGLYDAAEVAGFINRLKRLQDDLGDANDVRVGREIIAELVLTDGDRDAIARAGESVLAWHERRLAKREPKLRRHLDRLFDSAPFWSP